MTTIQEIRPGKRGRKASQNYRNRFAENRQSITILTSGQAGEIRIAEIQHGNVILAAPQTDQSRIAENRYGKLSPEVRQTYGNRIAELREYGAEDGITLNPASKKDFWSFVKSLPATRSGSLVLMDNGNLRVVWKGDQGSHLGLQFLGGQMIQYVIFKRRPGASKVSRVTGADTFGGIMRQIDAFELKSLVCR